jgi:nucleoid-associated protein YgaU
VPGRHSAPVAHPHLAAVATRAALLTGGVATGALSLPIVAQASPSVDWDAVARCESGNNWSIDTGNGYYGGLQFLDSTWHAYGGTTTHASQASEGTQIAVAERVLASQGIGAWPVCGPKGLGGHTADRGDAGASGAGGASSAPATTRRDAPRTVAEPTESRTPSRSSGSRAPETSTRSERVTPTPRHRGNAPQHQQQPVSTVRVLPGDTLSGIAVRHHVPGGWQALHALNRSVVGVNPHMIFPGQTLRLR